MRFGPHAGAFLAKDKHMTSHQANAVAAIVRRVKAARAAYDAASADPDTDFGPLQTELDDALDAFNDHRCESGREIAHYASLLWAYIDDTRRDIAQWDEDATAPLIDMWAVAAAVQRECLRLLVN